MPEIVEEEPGRTSRELQSESHTPEDKVGGAAQAGDRAIDSESLSDTSEEQLEVVMRKNNQVLFRIARSILRDDSEAEETVQSAYLTAFSKKAQFSGGPNISAWLRKITVNRAFDRLRQIEREQRAAAARRDVDTEWRAGSELRLTPEDVSAKREVLKLIEAASDDLPETLRTVFVLRDVQELSGAETAGCLGIAEGAVRVRLLRARALMRVRLGKQAEDLYQNCFEFAGERCDRIVYETLAALRAVSQ